MSLLRSLFGHSVGKKLLMAASGLALLLFLLVHLLGNLQLFAGPEALNHYAHALHSKPALVWLFRLGLIGLLAVHGYTSVVLTLENRAARPVPYHREDVRVASLGARTMIWSGLTVGAFIVYHLLHLTARVTGPVHHVMEGGPDVYANVVASFQDPAIAGFYLLAQIGLFFHLSHAFSSAIQTLGWHHRRYTPALEKAGLAYAWLILLGNSALVLAVLTGCVS